MARRPSTLKSRTRHLTFVACAVGLIAAYHYTSSRMGNNGSRRKTASKGDLALSSAVIHTPLLCSANAAAKNETRRPLRIACLGDSITWGDATHENPFLRSYRAYHNRGNYPKFLQSLLNGPSPEDGVRSGAGAVSPPPPLVEVRNFGHSGATACASLGRPYFGRSKFKEAVAFRPDIAVIMLGTNDATEEYTTEGSDCGRGSVASGMKQIISAQRRRGDKDPVVLIVPPPPILREWKEFIPSLLSPVRDELRSVVDGSSSSDAASADLGQILMAPDLPIPANDDYFVKDGVHLNSKGTWRVTCAVFQQLVDRFGGGVDGGCDNEVRSQWRQSHKRCDNLLAASS